MQPIDMIVIYHWDKKLKKRLHVLEADEITIELMFLAQTMHLFTERVPNDHHCPCLSNKSLSY